MDQKLKVQMCDKIIEGEPYLINASLIGGFVSILIGTSLLDNKQTYIIYDECTTKIVKIKNKRDKRIRYPRL